MKKTTYQIRKTMISRTQNIKSKDKVVSIIMNNSLGTVFETNNLDEVSKMCEILNIRHKYIGYKYEINVIN